MAETAHNVASAAHGGEAASGGMPQLDFSTFPNQIFWLVVTLVVVYLILSRVALPRVASVLADRQGAISKDIAAAEELKARAAQAEEAYNKALADARAQAQDIIAQTRSEIAAELADATAKADAQIAAKAKESEARIGEIRAGAVKNIEAVARDATAEIVTALGGGKPDAKALKAAIAERMKG